MSEQADRSEADAAGDPLRGADVIRDRLATLPHGRVVEIISQNQERMMRAPEIVEEVCKLTGAEVGGTSADGKFTVGLLECQGACANAPMFDLDGVYHEDLDEAKVQEILGGVK